MSYAQRKQLSGNRTMSIVFTAVVVGGLMYAIVTGLAYNVVKHAAASSVLVQLERHGDTVVLDVRDDGVGFDAERVLAGPPTGHLGLRVLADLARDAGATLAVRAAPGSGTHWRLTLPVASADRQEPPYRQKPSGSDATSRAARSKSWATGSSAR